MILLILNIIVSLMESILLYGIFKPKKLAQKYYCILIFVQCFILHAFLDPYKVVDLPGYIETFETFASNTLQQSIIVGYVGVKMEIGWIVLCKILSILYNNYIILLLVTSFIIVGSYCISIYKYSTIAWLSVFIFLCTMYDQSLYVLRQHTAMGICLLSLPYVVKRDIKKFALTLIIAMSIHSTAIVFGLVYPFVQLNYNKSFWIRVIIISLILSLVSSTLFNWFFTHTWYNSYGDREGSNYTSFLIALCSLLLCLYSINGNAGKLSKIEKCFLAMAIIGVMISFIGAGFSPTNRLVKYFTLSEIFLIPISIHKIKHQVIKNAIIIATVLSYSLLFFSTSNIAYIEDYRLTFF